MDSKNISAIQKISKNYKTIIKVLLFTCIPLIACYIICIKNGMSLNDIYLGNSYWNDEVLYFKITEAVAKFNEPLGYFGYNESSANIGQYGAWSPVIFVFYVLYAKIFGWSMMSPIYCNIILMMLAMFVFALLVVPTKKQMIYICLSYCSCTILSRYVLSGMPEVSIYSLLIIFLGFSIKVYRVYEDNLKIRYLIVLNILAFFLTLMRPYWILLFFVPIWYWYGAKKRKESIIIEGIISIVSIGGYFFIANNLCAQYLKPIIKLDWLKLLLKNPGKGIYNIFYILLSQMWNFFKGIGEGIVQGSPSGAMYAAFFMIMLYFAFCISKCRKTGKYQWSLYYGLGYLLIMLLAIFYLYDLRVGSRHVVGFILVFMLVFPLIETSGKRYLIFLAVFIWIFCARATDVYTYQLPIYTADKEADIIRGKDELADLVDVNAVDPWDNTILWLYGDETTVNFTYLYAVPGGMGINLCFKDYVLSNFEQLKPKYIITNIGEEVDLLCKEKQKELKAEYGNVHIWKLR